MGDTPYSDIKVSRSDLEFNKFIATSDDKVAVRTTSVSGGNLLEGIAFDAVVPSYPNTTTEIYVYKTGGTSGTTVATITVIYTTAAKDVLQSVART
jgi:hypothetical protein